MSFHAATTRLALPRGGAGPPTPTWLLAGAVALVAALPLAYVLVRAAGAGSATWSELIDARIPRLAFNTLALTAVVGAGALAIGGGLAWLVVRSDLPGRRAMALACALPLAIPPYVGAVVYADVLGPRGLLAQALEPLGVERLPSLFGFAGSAIVLVLFTFPYAFLLIAAALANLNVHFEEAARALGAGPARIAAITMRLILPAMAGAGLLVGLYVLSDFGAVSIMRFETFTTVIYEELGGRLDPAGAAALSSVLVVLTLGFLYVGMRLRGGARFVQTDAGSRRGSRRRLGRWRWPALVAASLVLALALVLPLARLLAWTIDTLDAGDLGGLAGYAGNSLLAAGLAATACAACALPVAIVAARGGRAGAILAGMSQSGYALPGVVVALAAVAIATRWFDPLYGTLALMIAAFVVRFLPQAVQGTEAGLQQIGGNLTEAARSLGAGRTRAFARVVLPLLRPALVASWMVVFLTAVRELPVTLVLRPIGFDTLPVRVWTPAQDGLYAEAGPAALALVLVSALPLAAMLLRRNAILAGPQ